MLALIGVYGGIILLARAWLDLLRVSRSHHGLPVRRVAGVIGAWAVPLALAPPLFSRDVYSYAGQGEMVAHGISPYLYGTGVLGVTPFSILPGPFWANTPSPYGPAFLWLDGLVTDLARHQVLADLVLLRLLAVAGLALALWAIPVLARAAGRDAAPAVVLALGSPLVLTTLVGGAHNDALMLGLLLAGLAVARRHGTRARDRALRPGRRRQGAGPAWPCCSWPGTGRARRPGSRGGSATAAAGCAIGLATLGAVSWTTGIGWGWVHTAAAPTKIMTGITPVDSASRLLTDVAHLVGFDVGPSGVRSVVAVVALTAVVRSAAGSCGARPSSASSARSAWCSWRWCCWARSCGPGTSPGDWPSWPRPPARWTRRAVIALAIGGTLVGAAGVVRAARTPSPPPACRASCWCSSSSVALVLSPLRAGRPPAEWWPRCGRRAPPGGDRPGNVSGTIGSGDPSWGG